MSKVDVFADDFGVSGNSSYTCVVELSTDPSYCVIVIFAAKFPLYTALIMAAVVERFFLVGGPYITSGTTP